MDDDPLESENLLKLIDKIEKENTTQVQNVPEMGIQKTDNIPKVPNLPVSQNSMNYNSVVQNVNRYPTFPSMYFPHSNVTINYNIKN